MQVKKCKGKRGEEAYLSWMGCFWRLTVELLVEKLAAERLVRRGWHYWKKRLGVGVVVPVASGKMELQGCWAAIDHGVEAEVAGIDGEEDGCRGGEEKTILKMLRKNWFFAHFALFSLAPQYLKSTPIYKGGRGTCCLYRGPILVLDSVGKDLNHWLKVVIMSC
jgi:hypothetical protein